MKLFYTIIIFISISFAGYAQSVGNADKERPANINLLVSPTFTVSKVYPNPVKDLVNVNINCVRSGQIQVSIFNILGTEVKKWDLFDVVSGEQKLQLDLSFLKTGVYILKFIKSDQVTSQVIKKV